MRKEHMYLFFESVGGLGILIFADNNHIDYIDPV